MQSSTPRKSEALIAFGANQGNCEAALESTVEALKKHPQILEIHASQPVQTKAVTGESDEESPQSDQPQSDQPQSDQPQSDQPQSEYLNAAIRVLTTLSPDQLHQLMVTIEQDLGRKREQRWGPRTIDLDLLLVGDLQLRTDDLTVPHPRMSFRRFVLQPALDIAAKMVHPESGMTLQQLVDHLDSANSVIVLATNDREFAESISHDAAIEVRIVQTDQEFMAQSPGSKLVIACVDDSKMDDETEKLLRFAHNFAGPTLRISQNQGKEACVKELRAAIQAME